MPSVAGVLISAMGISNEDRRRDFLRENPVLVAEGTMVHRIAGFDRRSATWMTFCGVSYGGNAYEEEVAEGMTNCMACTVGR